MDGLNSPLELAQAAKSLGQPALAVTDHGTLSSHRGMQEAAEKTGIKPILGLEAYLSPTDRFDRRDVKKREDNTQLYNHLVLLAKNQTGLNNLNKLSELAWTEGYYYKPRIDKEILDEYGEGLIVLSGCLNGVISKAIERGNIQDCDSWARWFVDRFAEDFYIEIQPDNPIEINRGLLDISRRFGAKTVVTADCHFAKPEDRAVEEAMLILSTNPTPDKTQTYELTKDLPIFERFNKMYPDRQITFEKLDLFIQNRLNMKEKLVKQGIESDECFESTLEIADKVEDYNYPKNVELLPIPKQNPDKQLEKMVWNGLKRLGLDTIPEYRDRAREELDIIFDKRFSPYFLIVADLVNWAKSKKIRVGPGRGSAAGSLICYATGITGIDPIKHKLLFFRFIDPSRPDWPDIDIDFEDRRRPEVKEYLRNKFKNVASVSTFGMFKDKGVIRDAARVFAVPLDEVNKALKGINPIPNHDFFPMFEQSEQGANFNKKYPEVMEYAKALRGRIRSVGMHAAGLVVAREPIENYAPIETRKDPDNKVTGRIPVVAYDMNVVADIGLIKIDALGLKTLSVISDTINKVEERHGRFIDPEDIPLDDSSIYEDLSEGNTMGVFQAEATPYTQLLKQMQVSNFEELAASNALIRPGAMQTVGPSYLARKKGTEVVAYAHDILKEFTQNTYGLIIYQEQVMMACVELGGMTMEEANKVRKIIGKKRDAKEFDEYKDKFIEGASKHVAKKVAQQLWHDFEAHAGYSFNYSHAIAYSLLGYWTAWLKHYYPTEFMYALLKNEERTTNSNMTNYLIEAKRLNIKILLPHVNKSDVEFTIEGDAIRFGLANIKYISDILAERLIRARPFNSYQELSELVDTKGSGINTRVLMALNLVGAAAFEDHPRTGEESNNYWEYLGIPKFKSSTVLDQWVAAKLVPIEDYSESDTFVTMGMVKKIKQGVGWSRVEIIDETGSVGVFDKEDTQLEPGQMYIVLVGSNRILDYVVFDDVNSADSPLVKYLRDELPPVSKGEYYILSCQRRMTKARKMMGTLVLVNANGELGTILCFPRQFPEVYTKAKPGTVVKMALSRLEDGTLCVQRMVS